MTSFALKSSQIPKFTTWGSYAVDVHWTYLEKHLAMYEDCYGLELEPDFQRAHVWDDDRRRRYVEFRLKGGRSAGDLLFNCAGWHDSTKPSPLVLVDGLQRLTAVRNFMANDLKVFQDLHPHGDGYYAAEIDGVDRGLTGPGFKVHVNDLPDRASVLRWYLEINDGGVVHTSEELDRVRDLLTKELQK